MVQKRLRGRSRGGTRSTLLQTQRASFAAASRTDYGWHVDGVARRSDLGLRGQITRREVARRLRLTAGDFGREYGDPGDLEHVDP